MKKTLLYIKKHADFIILDLAALIFGYWLVTRFRYEFSTVHHGELFFDYGVVLVVVYLIILLIGKSLSGVIKRSFFKECQSILVQVFVTWAFFTVVLYTIKTAQNFSRSVYAAAFALCYVFIVFERSAWKCFIRFSRFHSQLCPKLIVVCDGDSTQKTIKRVLRGSFENDYEIVGVVMTATDSNDYIDHFDSVVGIEKLDEFLADKKVDEAYIELSDATTETEVINNLLKHNILVHRSLQDSTMNYVEQGIDEISGHSVITIRDTQVSFVTRAERVETALFRKITKKD
ncbi:MAG: hypothetical protein J6M63_11620 [Pseudobutyrivibrio sp.]|uniref:nucleoside-diphosphate sugar epimerase/dehydratase n=1 Tax=Pseudobutyrivibrio sp. TaxID=2014367 RepID=UPI001B187864|nr:hypothetical protein [Pseudobutyrivibrio sp.]MBO6284567.1 hypothetical protein [Pseudobutyrivibrio sp.]MBP3260889.1 hypothetical protein [Pseudobutyrivibrio sp.]